MADKPADYTVSGTPVIHSAALATEHAPFVYFDTAQTYGAVMGVIQLELFANTLVPDGRGGVKVDLVVTGHIRCSPNAAIGLRQAIDGALAIAAQGQHPVPENQRN